jgi:CRISPR-associated endonuclease/helicase Cas3
MFSSAAKAFRLIDDSAISVIVNWGDSMALVEKLKAAGPTYSLMKELSQYTVNIYERDFKRLMQGGLVEEPYEGIYVIPDRAQYDVKSGLKLDNHWMEEILIH